MRGEHNPTCPYCHGLLSVKGKGGTFIGCSNWPKCKFTVTLGKTAREARDASSRNSAQGWGENTFHRGLAWWEGDPDYDGKAASMLDSGLTDRDLGYDGDG